MDLVMNNHFLSDFKILTMKQYSKNLDPQEHLTTYYFYMHMLGLNDVVIYQDFFFHSR